MEPNLFRNRWLALAFVGLVAVAAMALVGSEDEEGLLDRFVADRAATEPEVTEDLTGQQDLPSSELIPLERDTAESTEPAEARGSFSSEEELVDDTQGFDTTPMIVHDDPDHEGTVLEAEGETVIVESDVGGSEL